jgi:hypothetical protein
MVLSWCRGLDRVSRREGRLIAIGLVRTGLQSASEMSSFSEIEKNVCKMGGVNSGEAG